MVERRLEERRVCPGGGGILVEAGEGLLLRGWRFGLSGVKADN